MEFLALIVTITCLIVSILVFSLRSRGRWSFFGVFGGSEAMAATAAVAERAAYAGNGGGGVVAAAAAEMQAAAAETAARVRNGGGSGDGGEILEMEVEELEERPAGLSMMEQLVPEITTHALSYLDYPSLCRLSMTNSTMRRAANDDNAWKALYHKDFTIEQDNVRPVVGWKAYYAVTRAVVDINADFFRIIRERTVADMGRLWLNADYVKCIHASGEFFSGYNAVMESWQLAFNWDQAVDFQIRDVRVRVLADMAWVTMKAYFDEEHGSFNMTNVFECHNGQWYLVHHHSSVNVINGGADQPHMLG